MQWLFWVIYAWFSNKNVPYLILYQWTKFQYHTFVPSQDIKQSVLLSSYLYSYIINFKIYLRSTSKAMAEKERKMKIQKI